MVRQTIQRESIKHSSPPQMNKKQLSPKYASNAFNTFYASHSTNNINVNNNNHKSIFTIRIKVSSHQVKTVQSIYLRIIKVVLK